MKTTKGEEITVGTQEWSPPEVYYVLVQALRKGGETSFLDELTAQRALLSAQRDLADSNRQLAINLIAIYKALGG